MEKTFYLQYDPIITSLPLIIVFTAWYIAWIYVCPFRQKIYKSFIPDKTNSPTILLVLHVFQACAFKKSFSQKKLKKMNIFKKKTKKGDYKRTRCAAWL